MFFESDYSAGQGPSKPIEWMEPMIQEFYTVMGWNGDGCPGEKKLAELNIDITATSTDEAPPRSSNQA
jgi:aldehyde:ferredoxin oxidoreductase